MNLYIVFFLFGVCVFVGVVLYTLRESRNKEKKGAQLFETSGKKDPLFDDIKQTVKKIKHAPKVFQGEKTRDKDKADAKPKQEKKAAIAHFKQSQKTQANQEPATPAQALKIQRDPQTHAVLTSWEARIANTQPIEQKEIMQLCQSFLPKFAHKLVVFGFNQMKEEWANLATEQPAARFIELGLSLTLAEHNTACNEYELLEFQKLVEVLSSHLQCDTVFSMEAEQAHAQVKALKILMQKYDAVAALYIVSRSGEGFRIADLESCARDLGLSMDKNKVLQKTSGYKDNITVYYKIVCGDGSGEFGASAFENKRISALLAYMNISATFRPEEAINMMIEDAKSLATWLDGKVVDKDGKVLTQRSYTDMLQQVNEVIYQMELDGLLAGDAISKKLFG